MKLPALVVLVLASLALARFQGGPESETVARMSGAAKPAAPARPQGDRTIVAANRAGTEHPIPWGALSGLAAAPRTGDRRGEREDRAETVHAVHDRFYRESRVFTLDVSRTPAVLTTELRIVDRNGVLLAALTELKAQLPDTDDFTPADRVHADGRVNLDLEGIDVDGAGGFWLASEGRGNLVDGVSDPEKRPFEVPNMLVHVDGDGTVQEVVLPPLALTRNQRRAGYEGVAVDGRFLYVAFQRPWPEAGDASDRARIGRYDTATRTWSYVHYPLSEPTSPKGGWVGLSEITRLGEAEFLILERDNRGGLDATIKHITRVDLREAEFLEASQVARFELVEKTLVCDLIADGVFDRLGVATPEKLEGLAVLGGDILCVSDNDGADDNEGETVLVRVEDRLD